MRNLQVVAQNKEAPDSEAQEVALKEGSNDAAVTASASNPDASVATPSDKDGDAPNAAAAQNPESAQTSHTGENT